MYTILIKIIRINKMYFEKLNKIVNYNILEHKFQKKETKNIIKSLLFGYIFYLFASFYK